VKGEAAAGLTLGDWREKHARRRGRPDTLHVERGRRRSSDEGREPML
jgi:hypothetical protein